LAAEYLGQVAVSIDHLNLGLVEDDQAVEESDRILWIVKHLYSDDIDPTISATPKGSVGVTTGGL
jgi:hypothetical protein